MSQNPNPADISNTIPDSSKEITENIQNIIPEIINITLTDEENKPKEITEEEKITIEEDITIIITMIIILVK